ncbi:MAG TPA: FAD-binding oxidoreductase [Bauldia sp.]|nr:FAD-binding oxidoreductase [Bauldia sp.]
MNSPLRPSRIEWQEATIERIVELTPTVKSYLLRPARPFAFVAGQHVDIRLTAPDGYQAQRSYSIGSAPGGDTIELVVERLATGEVSPFFHEVVAVGDTIELRGPIGGHFYWRPEDGGPLLLIGGGSGVVPLMSMLRERQRSQSEARFVLIYSARTFADVIFRDELMRYSADNTGFSLILTLTREDAPMPGIRSGRIDRGVIEDALSLLGEKPRLSFICGATAFVEVASMFLVEEGVPPGRIRTERYGGSPAEKLDATVVVAPES